MCCCSDSRGCWHKCCHHRQCRCCWPFYCWWWNCSGGCSKGGLYRTPLVWCRASTNSRLTWPEHHWSDGERPPTPDWPGQNTTGLMQSVHQLPTDLDRTPLVWCRASTNSRLTWTEHHWSDTERPPTPHWPGQNTTGLMESVHQLPTDLDRTPLVWCRASTNSRLTWPEHHWSDGERPPTPDWPGQNTTGLMQSVHQLPTDLNRTPLVWYRASTNSSLTRTEHHWSDAERPPTPDWPGQNPTGLVQSVLQLATDLVGYGQDRLAPQTLSRLEFWSSAMVWPPFRVAINSFK